MCPGSQPAMQNTAITLAIRMMSTIQAKISSPDMATSTGRLRFREFPLAVQDFVARAIKARRVIPTRHDRQTVRNLAVATAELDSDRTIRIFLRGDVVQRVSFVGVLLEVAVGVVEADRPEAVDRHILDVEP